MSDEKPKIQSGGVNITGGSGNISIGGDVVGRDKVTTTTTTTGLGADAVAQLVQQFQQIQKKVDDLPESDDLDKGELKETVKKIEDEVKKGEEANPTKVERWLKFVASMSGDIAQVVSATLVNPAAGVGTAIRLVAEKAAQGNKP
jgi:hypothetical protein